MFSSRTPGDLGANRLTALQQQWRHDGRRFIDLTQSNPTRAGFDYPSDLLAPLAHPRGLAYRPQALGLVEAREAVVADYARRGASDQRRSHRAHGEHERGVLAAVQDAVRAGRRGA